MPEDDPAIPPVNETPAKGGGGKDKAGAAAAAESALPAPGNMIVEAALDWEKMEVGAAILFFLRPSPPCSVSSIQFAESIHSTSYIVSLGFRLGVFPYTC